MRTKAEYNEYMRAYLGRRYHRRRAEAIAQLGGACVDCGATEDLEFDHVDPATKAAEFGALFSTGSAAKLAAELSKAALRCTSCHQRKSILERGQQPADSDHGTLTGYSHRRCRCDLCRAAWNAHSSAYKRRKRAEARVAKR